MANIQFQSIVNDQLNTFVKRYKEAKELYHDDGKQNGLLHPGEYGIYRQNVTKEFLELFIPRKLEITSGFLINENRTSKQQDLIIYDHSYTPKWNANTLNNFVPVETVVAVGEVKSTITDVEEMKIILEKLVDVKKMREESTSTVVVSRTLTGKPDPMINPFDTIFTFLVCEKIKFKITPKIVKSLYPESIKPMDKHNAILSIDDGIILYTDGKMNLCFPVLKDINASHFIKNEENKHLENFIQGISMCLEWATIYSPDFIKYYTDKYFE